MWSVECARCSSLAAIVRSSCVRACRWPPLSVAHWSLRSAASPQWSRRGGSADDRSSHTHTPANRANRARATSRTPARCSAETRTHCIALPRALLVQSPAPPLSSPPSPPLSSLVMAKIQEEVKLDFKDVLIRPKRSTLKSRSQVSLERTIKMKHSGRELACVPIIAANMDTVGTFDMALALAKHKMLCAVHKHYSVEQWTAFVSANPDVVPFLAVSSGISEDDFAKLAAIVKAAPALTTICLDVANGYSEHFVTFVRRTRASYPQHTIIAGNVVTGEMVEELILSGADIVKVGIGPGSVCTTRKKTGVGYPQLSAVMECADAAHGLGGWIVSDGGCAVPGDLAKAFGAGADFVMLGGMLAGHDESGGKVIEGPDGKKSVEFYVRARHISTQPRIAASAREQTGLSSSSPSSACFCFFFAYSFCACSGHEFRDRDEQARGLRGRVPRVGGQDGDCVVPRQSRRHRARHPGRHSQRVHLCRSGQDQGPQQTNYLHSSHTTDQRDLRGKGNAALRRETHTHKQKHTNNNGNEPPGSPEEISSRELCSLKELPRLANFPSGFVRCSLSLISINRKSQHTIQTCNWSIVRLNSKDKPRGD